MTIRVTPPEHAFIPVGRALLLNHRTTQRMKTTEQQPAVSHEIRVDSNEMLMHTFNTINENKQSEVFVYKGVKFWREDYEFIMSYNNEAFLAGVVTDFDEFKEMLLDQKL